MKVVSILFAVLFSANVFANDAVVVVNSGNLLNGTNQTITLKTNGLVYVQESDYINETSTKEKPFARVQNEQQLVDVLNAIEKVPANAQLSQPDFELCEIDGTYSVEIFSDKFAGGSLVIKTTDCGDGTQIVGKNAQWARAIVKLIESSYEFL